MPLKSRLKTALFALLATTLWMAGLAPVKAAGTTPLALAVQRDSAGNETPGCLLYFYVAGTVAAPQNAFADFGLTTALPNPLQCDQAGRVPMHWLADGLIHIRLTDSRGAPIVDATLQVLGPSGGGGGGGGGGGTVDPTSILATGDLKARYGTGPLSGFVRANGLSIGNATSGASERANADTQALFVYLYNADPNIPVSGGRTGNALNDFNASKQLFLPDWRGRALAFLDDMGNVPAGRLTATYFGNNATVLGAFGGQESRTLTLGQLPTGITSNNPTNAISVFPNGSSAQVVPSVPSASAIFVLSSGNYGGGAARPIEINAVAAVSNFNTFSAPNAINVTSNNTSGQAHAIVQPTQLGTLYIKL